MSKFFERFKRLNEYKPSEDEKEAGLERLNNLGPIVTALALAERTNRTEEEVYQQPAEAMYMVLLVDFEKAEYQKRLRRVQEENEILERKMRS